MRMLMRSGLLVSTAMGIWFNCARVSGTPGYAQVLSILCSS